MTEKAKAKIKQVANSLWVNGLPGHIFPPLLLGYAVLERVLGGFSVGHFYDLANSDHNIMTELFFISMGGTVGMKWVKGKVAVAPEGEGGL